MGDSTTHPILSKLLTPNVWATCGYTEDFVTVYTEVRHIQVSLYYFWVRKQWDYCYHILICSAFYTDGFENGELKEMLVCR